MARVAASLPGYATVARASEVLHLAPRSVRDLIYSGRVPSLRIGRLHYIRGADLEQERRRRLGLPPTARRNRRQPPSHPRRERSTTPRNHSLDAALRRQRAAERAELVSRWAQRHAVLNPRLPAHVKEVSSPIVCEVCGRTVRNGRYVELTPDADAAPSQLCVTCGRRALLEWADQRRQEATAARHMAHSLGEPELVDPRPAELLQQALLPATDPAAAPREEATPTSHRAA